MPAAYRKAAKGKKVKVTKTVRPAKMSDPLKAGVLAVVRRMIDRNTEEKMAGSLVELNVDHNSPIGSADCQPIVREIRPVDTAAGNTSCQRIGDRIKPKSLKVSGVLSINPEQGTAQQGDIYARVIIASQKDIKVGQVVDGGGVDVGSLLRPALDGVGQDQVAFTGLTQDLLHPINLNKFKVYYDKTFKFSMTKTLSQDTWDNYSKRWSYTFKELPASFTFDEGNGNWVNNFAPFVAIGYAYSDGTAPDTLQTKLISNTYSILKFEDA